ncbi:hypothetical protein P170DRAFT_345037 [Aspergillus steynii IBT 23096]|uniref:Survival Motor Neuron Gemin2-binding domain-containing protein n=1 Tax=Aspergillus steynii IBT 23096 TaxID=1392250 RepID=A0A2I2GNA9_9EURO|nr:uncharacterized protein P170DRAFT_345037 [Aspergillus steynii IBT 23096]PLB54356.1 hypothetical protein P170DRAFT_345037 [Aspergillus steynii IBT 23096]
MGKSKNATKALTQEEIWDDSALVQSWDEAVDEYKLYHSIQAKGENVEDVLRQAEGAELTPDDAPGQDPNKLANEPMETDGEEAAISGDSSEAVQPRPGESSRGINSMAEGISLGAAMPQAALSQVQDEGLKNLMMSWYFAGYYTGLYEGQQRANQNKSS